jgi:hypothetical protein
MGATLFPLGRTHVKGGRLAHQFLADFVSDDETPGPALLAMAVFGMAGMTTSRGSKCPGTMVLTHSKMRLGVHSKYR